MAVTGWGAPSDVEPLYKEGDRNAWGKPMAVQVEEYRTEKTVLLIHSDPAMLMEAVKEKEKRAYYLMGLIQHCPKGYMATVQYK